MSWLCISYNWIIFLEICFYKFFYRLQTDVSLPREKKRKHYKNTLKNISSTLTTIFLYEFSRQWNIFFVCDLWIFKTYIFLKDDYKYRINQHFIQKKCKRKKNYDKLYAYSWHLTTINLTFFIHSFRKYTRNINDITSSYNTAFSFITVRLFYFYFSKVG